QHLGNWLYVFLFCLGVFQTETTSVTGTVGGSVTITCSHSYATTNVKYFCKGTCVDADVLIKSSTQREGKYSIKDNGNTFYVTISNLEMSDGGVYWCGIERVGVDTYGKVTLTVEASLNRVCFVSKACDEIWSMKTCQSFPFAFCNRESRKQPEDDGF
uniref:Ig-like domain-containing protein n=1 Tax=Xiphophorus maculatus TaxID=8083 RepID=A0A3B5QBW0_XIPMA